MTATSQKWIWVGTQYNGIGHEITVTACAASAAEAKSKMQNKSVGGIVMGTVKRTNEKCWDD